MINIKNGKSVTIYLKQEEKNFLIKSLQSLLAMLKVGLQENMVIILEEQKKKLPKIGIKKQNLTKATKLCLSKHGNLSMIL